MFNFWIFLNRFFRRLSWFSASGISTYLLDLAIIAILVMWGMNYNLAIGIGYVIGISTNYVLCHQMVYRGTERKFWHGYVIFMSLAMIGMGLILALVNVFMYYTDWNLLVIRTIVAAIVGFCGFIVNTFFNFKLL